MSYWGLTMAEEAKAAWVAALRSGQYQQDRGVLEVMDGYTGKPLGLCCLGVLLVTNGMVGQPDWSDSNYHLGGWIGTCSFMLPDKRLGRKSSRGLPTPEWSKQFFSYEHGNEQRFDEAIVGLHSKLADMNDNGMSFNAIADWIEANL